MLQLEHLVDATKGSPTQLVRFICGTLFKHKKDCHMGLVNQVKTEAKSDVKAAIAWFMPQTEVEL
jgi:hypothetical protein